MANGALVPSRVGRYALFAVLAKGGMASVHLGRLSGAAGFARIVAIKRLHPQFAADAEFRAMFKDEARLSARIRHPNVVPVIDVELTDDELLLVMEYVEGETLAGLVRLAREKDQRVPTAVAAAIVRDVLAGVGAAHDARAEDGTPLGLIHRDISPQNVIVGVDGVARLADFGIAKAAGRSQETRSGELKGKLRYMAPEQFRGRAEQASDLFSIAGVFWEVLAGKHRLEGDDAQIVTQLILEKASLPSSVPGTTEAYDEVIERALRDSPGERYASAREMAVAMEAAGPRAEAREVADWVRSLASVRLEERRRLVQAVELEPSAGAPTERPPAIGPGLPGETPRRVSPRRGVAVVVTLVVAAAALALAFASRRPSDGTRVASAPGESSSKEAAAAPPTNAEGIAASASAVKDPPPPRVAAASSAPPRGTSPRGIPGPRAGPAAAAPPRNSSTPPAPRTPDFL